MEGLVTYSDGREETVGDDWLLDHYLDVIMLEVTGGKTPERQAILVARLRDRTFVQYPCRKREECLQWIESHRDRFFGVKLRVFGVDSTA